jgi:hypothetical protein
LGDEARWLQVLKKAKIFVDPRKFREYVLVPGHPSGKDRVFLELLGYRSRNPDDAIALARLYEEQARQRILIEDVQFTGTQQHGRRYIIVIVVRGVALRSGWLLRHDGTLWLTTPFRGFTRASK